MIRSRRLAALVVIGVFLAACTEGAPRSTDRESAPEPPPETAANSWIVAVGDSYISGEGARWAANTNGAARPVDALGPRAYADDGNGESQRGCHRARFSEVQVGNGLRATTLACSGATTSSSSADGVFKPGLDFFDDDAGHVGQAAQLEQFASDHRVSDVVVSIGGNDFGFGQVVAQCAGSFLSTVAQPQQRPCSGEPAVRARFTREQARLIETRIVDALRNIARAMQRAGYDSDDYTLVVQTYPSPIPPGPRFRYAETLLERGFVGGCPFFDADATWADQHALATINGAVRGAATKVELDNLHLLDLTDVLVGHRLCERGAQLFDPDDFTDWRSAGVAATVEWVNRIYTGGRPWQVQESLHPNYWGVLAARAELAKLLVN